MIQSNEGLTATYNRFHDPYEDSEDIHRLRALHEEMDRATLAAYGWEDLKLSYDFYLDYEIDEATWGNKKKPYRYRWPDALREEVLARLLDLNKKQYEAEQLAGAQAASKKPRRSKKKSARKKAPRAKRRGPKTGDLPFDET